MKEKDFDKIAEELAKSMEGGIMEKIEHRLGVLKEEEERGGSEIRDMMSNKVKGVDLKENKESGGMDVVLSDSVGVKLNLGSIEDMNNATRVFVNRIRKGGSVLILLDNDDEKFGKKYQMLFSMDRFKLPKLFEIRFNECVVLYTKKKINDRLLDKVINWMYDKGIIE